MKPILFLSLMVASWAYSPQVQNAPANRPQPSAPQQRGSDSLPITVKLVNTGKTEAEAAQEAQRIEEDRRLANQTYRLNFALFFATVVTLIVLAFQSYWLRRDVRHAELATRIDLRAYVRAALTHHSGEVYIRLENVGKTPAQITQFLATVYHGPKSWWKGAQAEEVQTPVALAPGATGLQGPFDLPELTPEDQKQMATGDPAWVYVYGVVRYTDVFGSTWSTEYCYDTEASDFRSSRPALTLTQGRNRAT